MVKPRPKKQSPDLAAASTAVDDDDPRIVALASELFELRLRFDEMVAEQQAIRAELARLSRRKPALRSVPKDWLNLKTAADISGASNERLRILCVRGDLIAELIDGVWWLEPLSLERWNCSRRMLESEA